MDKKKYEYVVGIDFGHGETSAAICPLQWDQDDQQLEQVKDLEMRGNSKVIPSAIAILDDGTAYIGDSAFHPDILKKASVHVCFKKEPEDIAGEAEKIMIRFMKEVYLLIRSNNIGTLQDGNHLVYIATPSGWNNEQQALYVEMAKQAGIPIAGVTKESRAAFVRAQQNVQSGRCFTQLFFFSMPSTLYSPNSRFLCFIRKLLVYRMRITDSSPMMTEPIHMNEGI